MGDASGKEPTCQCKRHEMWVQSLGWEDALEEGMATHSSIPAWRIPMDQGAWWIQSIRSQRVESNLTCTHANTLKLRSLLEA